MRLSEVLALAGGVSEGGGDTVVVTTIIEGTPKRIEVDLTEIFLYGKLDRDLALRPGDAVYVDKAPVFYVYGQVQRPGMYPLERGMTLAQALAKGGGLTLRGTDRGLKVHRREASGDIRANDVRLDEAVRPADLIMVRESLF
jgi:polysaccharide export outer membrane protein